MRIVGKSFWRGDKFELYYFELRIVGKSFWRGDKFLSRRSDIGMNEGEANEKVKKEYAIQEG